VSHAVGTSTGVDHHEGPSAKKEKNVLKFSRFSNPIVRTSYYYASKVSRRAQMICDRKTIGIGYFPAKAWFDKLTTLSNVERAKALRLWVRVENVGKSF
jgi:hypothetical protein